MNVSLCSFSYRYLYLYQPIFDEISVFVFVSFTFCKPWRVRGFHIFFAQFYPFVSLVPGAE